MIRYHPCLVLDEGLQTSVHSYSLVRLHLSSVLRLQYCFSSLYSSRHRAEISRKIPSRVIFPQSSHSSLRFPLKPPHFPIHGWYYLSISYSNPIKPACAHSHCGPHPPTKANSENASSDAEIYGYNCFCAETGTQSSSGQPSSGANDCCDCSASNGVGGTGFNQPAGKVPLKFQVESDGPSRN